MKDPECVSFLQWCLPQMKMCWAGFRKVRHTVCKRVQRRLRELDLAGVEDYRHYLESNPDEWSVLDRFCRIPISRFFRDRGLFSCLRDVELPRLAAMAAERGEDDIRCWSVGCASGEEAYTLNILWQQSVQPDFPELDLRIVATDIDEILLKRAERGCYSTGSLKDVPPQWLRTAFTHSEQQYCIKDAYRQNIEFRQEDIRAPQNSGSFHLILCRNLVFTYFDSELQKILLQRIMERMVAGGVLVIGSHELLPEKIERLHGCHPDVGLFRVDE